MFASQTNDKTWLVVERLAFTSDPVVEKMLPFVHIANFVVMTLYSFSTIDVYMTATAPVASHR